MVGVHTLWSLMPFSFLYANRWFVAGSCWPVQGGRSTFSAFSCDCCVELITEFAVELFIEFRSGLLVTHLWSHFLKECGWRGGWQSHCSLYPANRQFLLNGVQPHCSLYPANRQFIMGCNRTTSVDTEVRCQWIRTLCSRNSFIFGGYSKTRYENLVTRVESHASAVSLLESSE